MRVQVANVQTKHKKQTENDMEPNLSTKLWSAACGFADLRKHISSTTIKGWGDAAKDLEDARDIYKSRLEEMTIDRNGWRTKYQRAMATIQRATAALTET